MRQLDERLSEVSKEIVETLKKNKKKLAMAESCTGGLGASSIVSVDGASEVFCGGIVAYTPKTKAEWLGVKESTMKKHGLVSKQTAAEMAKGALSDSGADYALSFTGLAGSSTNGIDDNMLTLPIEGKEFKKKLKKNPDAFKPVGLVYAALAVRDMKKAYVIELNLTGKRNTIRKKAVLAGFCILLNELGR